MILRLQGMRRARGCCWRGLAALQPSAPHSGWGSPARTPAAPEVADPPPHRGRSRPACQAARGGPGTPAGTPTGPPNTSSLCDGPADLPQLAFGLGLGVGGALFIPVADGGLFPNHPSHLLGSFTSEGEKPTCVQNTEPHTVAKAAERDPSALLGRSRRRRPGPHVGPWLSRRRRPGPRVGSWPGDRRPMPLGFAGQLSILLRVGKK